MAERRALPDPQLVQSAPFCLKCGYSLEGLRAPNACPECGLIFEDGRLMLAGVPKVATAQVNPLRRFVWVVVFVLALGLYFGWLILIQLYPWLLAGMAGVLLICVVWLLSTSQRERSAYERFVVTSDGIARLPFKMKEGEANIDTVFVAWGDADAYQLKRVGPFWKRLIVCRRGVGNVMEHVIFDAGIRCPDEQAQMVMDVFNNALNRHMAVKTGTAVGGGAGAPVAVPVAAPAPDAGQTGAS